MSSLSPDFQSRIEGLYASYRAFLAEHQTDILVRDVIVLYGMESVEERNTTHEVDVFLPDYISIGNDSGDYEFLLKHNGSEMVLWEDPGCFNAPTLEVIHSSFPVWLAKGCPLPEVPARPIPLQGRIWLLTSPPEGMKDMFRINKLLSMNWSIPQMKQSLASLPALLIEDGMPYAVHRILEDHHELRSWLGFSEIGQEAIQCYADFDPIDGTPIQRQ
jgi:hypothetical protein